MAWNSLLSLCLNFSGTNWTRFWSSLSWANTNKLFQSPQQLLTEMPTTLSHSMIFWGSHWHISFLGEDGQVASLSGPDTPTLGCLGDFHNTVIDPILGLCKETLSLLAREEPEAVNGTLKLECLMQPPPCLITDTHRPVDKPSLKPVKNPCFWLGEDRPP